MRLIFRCLVLALVAAAPLQPSSLRAAQPDGVQQLRIYEIFEHNKEAFHARFRDHAIRIMKSYGFKIVAIWEAKGATRTEFAYILDWPNETVMEESWKRFMADTEWAEIKRISGSKHGRMVGEIQSRVLRKTDYSPDLTEERPKPSLIPADPAS